MYSSITLSEKKSPFCCLTAQNDSLYVLDISTGYVYMYQFSEITAESSNGRRYPNYITMIRAYHYQSKKQVIFLPSGELHYLTSMLDC